VDKIKTERDGVNRSEERLAKLSKDIDGKLQLLGQLTNADVERNRPSSQRNLTPQDREYIKELKRQGWTIQSIAKAMKRTETEIELLLEIPD
jgi:DNA-binding NarL/FixJ family response regulator